MQILADFFDTVPTEVEDTYVVLIFHAAASPTLGSMLDIVESRWVHLRSTGRQLTLSR